MYLENAMVKNSFVTNAFKKNTIVKIPLQKSHCKNAIVKNDILINTIFGLVDFQFWNIYEVFCLKWQFLLWGFLRQAILLPKLSIFNLHILYLLKILFLFCLPYLFFLIGRQKKIKNNKIIVHEITFCDSLNFNSRMIYQALRVILNSSKYLFLAV